MSATAFGDAALAYFAERAIDPERAAQLAVREAGGALVYTITMADGQTFERRRPLDGNGPAKVLQPAGQPLVGWWPAGRPAPGGIALVCEGESDALAALSALPYGPKVAGLADLPVVAIPGTGFPVAKLAEELVAVGASQALLCFDADPAGRTYTERAAVALAAACVQPAPVELSDGQDLAAALAQIDTPDARGEWLANLLVDAGCAAPAEAVETNGGPPPLAAGGRYAGRVLNVAELLARPEEPIPWRCEGIAADGYLTVLAGRGGEGKSWMALALACGVARGKPAAGIPCAAGRSLIFDAENGPPLIARRLRAAQVGPDLALQPVDVGGLRFTDDLDWMRGEIEGQGADLVIFDSLRVLSSGAKESDADEMEPIITRLKQLARDTGAAVVLIHHRGKSEINEYRGSSVILDQTDMLFTLGRVAGDPDRRHRRKLTTVKCRIDEEPEPVWVKIDADRSRGLVTVTAAEPYDSEDGGRPRDALRGQVLDQLTGISQPRARIAAALGRDKSDQTVRRVLGDLEAEGLAEQHDDGWVVGGGHPGHLGNDHPDHPPENGSVKPKERWSPELTPATPETPADTGGTGEDSTVGEPEDSGVNGWTDEAADAFIERAKQVFPGSYEVEAPRSSPAAGRNGRGPT